MSAGLSEEGSGISDTYSYLCCCNSYGPDPNPREVSGKASIYLSGLCMKSQETFANFCRGELSNHGTHFGRLGTDP